MTTLIAKDTSGRWQAGAGETELVAARSRAGKLFDLGDGQRRAVATVGPIHYQADPFTQAAWQEIDVDIEATPGEAWDYGTTTNGWEFRCWQAVAGNVYAAQFRRAGRWFGMAPIGLWYVNGAGDRQLVGRPTAGITPQIDNDRNFMRWANCFGPGLDYGYDLSGVSRLFKFVRIRAKTDLPTPTIPVADIRLVVVIALAWDNEVATESGFANASNTETLPTDEAWSAPDEELDNPGWSAWRDVRGDLWFVDRPRAWDSADDDLVSNHSIPLGWRIQRRGDRVIGLLAVNSADLNNPAVVYPVFIDVDVNEQVPAAADDARHNNSAPDWAPAANQFSVGNG